MGDLSVMPKKARQPEPSAEWDQVMELDEPGLELAQADREMFNYSFEYYAKESYANAFKGFRELAEKGSSVSQYFIGVMYLRGAGTLQDFVGAHMWLNIAASKGHKKARNHLEKLTDKMSCEQLAEAQMLARKWVETHEDAIASASSVAEPKHLN